MLYKYYHNSNKLIKIIARLALLMCGLYAQYNQAHYTIEFFSILGPKMGICIEIFKLIITPIFFSGFKVNKSFCSFCGVSLAVMLHGASFVAAVSHLNDGSDNNFSEIRAVEAANKSRQLKIDNAQKELDKFDKTSKYDEAAMSVLIRHEKGSNARKINKENREERRLLIEARDAALNAPQAQEKSLDKMNKIHLGITKIIFDYKKFNDTDPVNIQKIKQEENMENVSKVRLVCNIFIMLGAEALIMCSLIMSGIGNIINNALNTPILPSHEDENSKKILVPAGSRWFPLGTKAGFRGSQRELKGNDLLFDRLPKYFDESGNLKEDASKLEKKDRFFSEDFNNWFAAQNNANSLNERITNSGTSERNLGSRGSQEREPREPTKEFIEKTIDDILQENILKYFKEFYTIYPEDKLTVKMISEKFNIRKETAGRLCSKCELELFLTRRGKTYIPTEKLFIEI